MNVPLPEGGIGANEVRRLYEASVGEGFCAKMLELVAELIPVTHTAFKELDGWTPPAAGAGLATGTGPVLRRMVTHPFRPEVEKLAPLFLQHLPSHPLFPAYEAASPHPRRISDTMDLRRFMKTAIYREFYRPLRVKHQKVVFLEAEKTSRVAVTLNRGSGDFSDSEVTLLSALQPHLSLAFRNAQARDGVRAALEQVGSGFDELGCAVLLVSEQGGILWQNLASLVWLEDLFAERAMNTVPLPEKPKEPPPIRDDRATINPRPNHLPPELKTWLDRVRPCVKSPHGGRHLGECRVAARGGIELLVKCAAVGASGLLLILRRERSSFEPAVLRMVGLTEREGDVLRLVSEAKTDKEIGIILGVSPRTVQKHVQHLLPKLEVENRHQAQLIGGELRRQFE